MTTAGTSFVSMNNLPDERFYQNQNRFIMNKQSKKTEKFEPQDSDQKNIKHPGNDQEAVLKPEDKIYKKENADFADPARRREQNEQPVHPIKKAPR
jgi:hypothetical protein